jgi:hypothetical protein
MCSAPISLFSELPPQQRSKHRQHLCFGPRREMELLFPPVIWLGRISYACWINRIKGQHSATNLPPGRRLELPQAASDYAV